MAQQRPGAPYHAWVAAAALAISSQALAAPSDWPSFGRTSQNTSSNPSEYIISGANVGTLAPKWVATVSGSVSARPAVVGNVVYFPDWGGNLWALNAQTGAIVWAHSFSSYGLPNGTVARATPTVVGNTLYIGTQPGGYMVAVSLKTGALRWKAQLDTHPTAIITAAASYNSGLLYVGVASVEENAAVSNSYPCCSFRGSIVAVNAKDGSIAWKFYTVPPNYTGGSVWGSAPVVDAARGSVFFGTGNSFSTSTDPAYQSCIANGGTEATCLSPDDHVESIVALDAATGNLKWAQRLTPGDDWNVACFYQGVNCPANAGPDADFGSGVNEITTKVPKAPVTIIGAGRKDGTYSAFDPDTGAMLWSTQVGPGSSLGGIEWGSASDGNRIYVAIANLYGIPYAAGNSGSWSALNPLTGAILWRTPDPNGTMDLGPVAVANGVVYAGSISGSGNNMIAMNAATGNILWSYPSGGSVIAGAAISNGTVFWGSGYDHLPLPGFVGNNKFYAFTPNGQ